MIWNNREVVQVTHTYIFKQHFRFHCGRHCLSSLLAGTVDLSAVWNARDRSFWDVALRRSDGEIRH